MNPVSNRWFCSVNECFGVAGIGELGDRIDSWCVIWGDQSNRGWRPQGLCLAPLGTGSALCTCITPHANTKTSKHSYLYEYWWIFASFSLNLCFIHPFLCNLLHGGILSRSHKAAPVCLSAFPVRDEVINGAKTWILSAWVKLMEAQLLHHQ